MTPPFDHTAAYANRLLRDLGEVARVPDDDARIHPALRWAQSGAMALTGAADGEPQLCPVPLAACADAVIAALGALSGAAALADIDGGALLGERAAIAGHARAGSIAPGGGCRLLRAANGVVAINLARDSDWELLPALLEGDAIGSGDWAALAAALLTRDAGECVERGRLLGLAVAALDDIGDAAVQPRWHRIVAENPAGGSSPQSFTPLVVDLSALWAGPLCSHLLQRLGARVIKVESLRRPDGARNGPPAFFDLLNAGKSSVALDLAAPQGREQLRQLLRRADIVIEASRPRALRQLGIDAEELVAERGGLTWLSLSGYGREEPLANWIAYGDDAAVAAGLSHWQGRVSGMPLFVGDAIADPLTGLHAALAGISSFRRGGSRLIELALRDVVAHCIRTTTPIDTAALHERQRDWRACIAAADIAAPHSRSVAVPARALGADNAAVFAELNIPC